MIEYDDDGFVVMEDVPDTDLSDDELGAVGYDDPPPLGDAAWLRMVSTAVGHEQDPVAADSADAAAAEDAGDVESDDLPVGDGDLEWSIGVDGSDGPDDSDAAWSTEPVDDKDDDAI